MNAIQNKSCQSLTGDINELKRELDTHAFCAQCCDEFFNTQSMDDDEQTQYKHFFFKMFSIISQNNPGPAQWTERCRQMSADADLISSTEEQALLHKELDTVKVQIEWSEKANVVFGQKFTSLMQNNAEMVLNKYGDIFFFMSSLPSHGTIGECHCCPSMHRENRNTFSKDLCNQIGTFFPGKKSLSVASIGAGSCFHELEIHALALEKGICISEWTMVDPAPLTLVNRNFTTMVNWATPGTTVTSICYKSDEYFSNLKNSGSTPDVFLFIDIDLHVHPNEVVNYAQKCSHKALFVYFSKKQQRAEFYKSSGHK